MRTTVPAAEFRAQPHRAAVQIGQRARDGEAEAGALVALGELALDLLERLAEPPQRIRRDADPGVGDHEHDRVAQHLAAHGDPALVGGELHRVGEAD
jgi:hypothetical protein